MINGMRELVPTESIRYNLLMIVFFFEINIKIRAESNSRVWSVSEELLI